MQREVSKIFSTNNIKNVSLAGIGGIVLVLVFINLNNIVNIGNDSNNVSNGVNLGLVSNDSENNLSIGGGNLSVPANPNGGGGSGGGGSNPGPSCTPSCLGKVCGESNGCSEECWQAGCENNVEKEEWGNYLFHGAITEIVPVTVNTFNDRLEYDMELMYKIGVDVISPDAGNIHLTNSLSQEWWWREWINKYNGLLTPWKLVWNDNPYGWPKYGESNPASFSSQERFDIMKIRFQQIIDASEGHVAEYKGKPILNWAKENEYTYTQGYGYHMWTIGLYPEDALKFVDSLEREFGTIEAFNLKSRENYASWDEMKQDNFYLFVKYLCDFQGCIVNPDPRNYYEHPYLFFRYVHFVDDMVMGDYFNGLAENAGIWKLVNHYVPFRHKERLAFLHANTLEGESISSTDYYTRKDPDKLAFIAGLAQGAGAYEFKKVLHSKYYRDKEFANFFGSLSRIGGDYLMGFDATGRFYWNELFSDWKRHPSYLRNLKWWSDFFEEQNWILDDMLTEKPKIAMLSKDLELSYLETLNTSVMNPIIPVSYSKHYIDWEAILNNELDNYDYFIFSSPRLPEEVLDKIVEFKNNGGTVIGIFGAGLFNLFGERTSHFEELFDVLPDKYLDRPYAWANTPSWRNEFDSSDSFYQLFHIDSNVDNRFVVGGVANQYGDRYISVIPQGNTEVIGNIVRNGDIISTISEDKKGIYYGANVLYNIFDTQIIVKLLELAKIDRRLVARNSSGDEITSYFKENVGYDSYMAILINEHDDPLIDLEIKGLNDYDVWDIRKEIKIGTIEDNSLSLNIPTEEPMILLISKNQNLINKFIEVQKRVNQASEELFDFDGGNMIFFVKVDYTGFNINAQNRNVDISPNAVIVVGEGVSQEGRDFANTLQKLFYVWNNGNQRILLDILSPDEVTEDILNNMNLVLIGGPDENSLSKDLMSGDYGLDESKGISGRQRNGWYDGGNVNMILDNEIYYKEFYDFIRVNAGHSDTTQSPLSAPYEGYKFDISEVDKKWGWGYSRGWHGYPNRTDSEIWRSEGDLLIVNASNDYGSGGVDFTTSAFLHNINWYDMNYSVEVKLQNGDSEFGVRIGEYMFLIEENNWRIVNFTTVYITPLVFDSGSIIELNISEFNNISVELVEGVFKGYINGELIASRTFDIDRRERSPGYYAKDGIAWIKDMEVYTREYDSVPLLSPELESENIFIRIWEWFKNF